MDSAHHSRTRVTCIARIQWTSQAPSATLLMIVDHAIDILTPHQDSHIYFAYLLI